MKTITLLTIFLLLITLSGCDEHEGVFNSNQNVKGEDILSNHQIIVIDGCEYIYYSEVQVYSGFGFLAHKGNCKNPIHIYNIK